MKKYCFGIDIGGTTVKCGLFSVEGEILEKWEIPTRTENNGAAIVPDVAAAINAKIEEKNLNRDEIAGAGVGIPGPVGEDGKVFCAVNLHWGEIDLEKELGELIGIPVKAGNDANVAALGEMWKGGGAGYHNVVMITLGTGVGGGIILNGKILNGTHGGAGEIGHIHVEDSETENCNCGNCGCLEQYASATGVVRLAKQMLAGTDIPSSLREGEVSAKTIFDAVKAGDELAMQIAEKFGQYLGTAMANVANVVDPEVFVVGGGVSKAGQVLLGYIQKYYQKYAFKGGKETAFTLAKLGNDAGICGAARLVLD